MNRLSILTSAAALLALTAAPAGAGPAKASAKLGGGSAAPIHGFAVTDLDSVQKDGMTFARARVTAQSPGSIVYHCRFLDAAGAQLTEGFQWFGLSSESEVFGLLQPAQVEALASADCEATASY